MAACHCDLLAKVWVDFLPTGSSASSVAHPTPEVTSSPLRTLRAWSTEDRLRLLEALYGQSHEAIAVLDPQGFFIDQNEAHRRLVGYSDDELRGKTAALHVGANVCADLMRVVGQGRRFRQDVDARSKDGRELAIDLSAFAVHDQTGAVSAHVLLLADRKRAADELRRINEELEQRVKQRTLDLETAIRERESFSYSVSHDLRTPLRTIRGFATILREDYHDRLDAKAQQYLDFIQGATNRMAEIIDDLLTLSRITRSELRRRPVDLSRLAQSVADRLREENVGRDVHLAVTPGLEAEADPHLMQVVLENLFENAWKFTRRTARPTIEFGVEAVEGERRFFVRDNGAGFDMAYVERLFKPFQRLHSVREFEGNGIGLATVARIIERHGGRVAAQGLAGQGATFYFTL